MRKLSFKPKVIGVAGTAASGKDSVANIFVKKYGFKKILLSNYLREEARKRHHKPDRDYLRRLQAILKREHGRHFLVAEAIDTILKKDHIRMKNIVIVGLRAPEETRLAKNKLKAKIIFVDANPFIRYKRAKERRRQGFAKTYTSFLHEEALENAAFDFHLTKKYVDFKIDNSGTIKDLEKQLDKLAKKLKLNKK